MKLSTKASRMVNTMGLKLKQHSPEILMTVGIVGMVASTVSACKATTKIDHIIDEVKYKKEQIDIVMNDEDLKDQYTEEDKVKDLTIIYTQSGVKLFKLYAPAIALGVFSIGCIVSGHRILKKRNLALAAAYTVVDRGFKQYRKNVVDRFGEELDKELRYNIKTKEVEKITKDTKGKEKVEKETVAELDPATLAEYSPYARFYDAGSKYFEKNHELDLMFLRRQQDYANELLKRKGHLFLNEVYDLLGIPRSQPGQEVGWVYNSEDPLADNCVDFGVYDITKEGSRRFVNGLEHNILLDFNVDGPILSILEK